MARSIEPTPNALFGRYTGLDAVLCLRRHVTVPYSSIRSVSVGLTDVPAAFALRIGLTTAPFGSTRRGTFWWSGKRLFLDFKDPARAVVLELTGERDDVVAIEPGTSPDELAAALRDRAALP